jgi:hypothetical protein
MASPIDPPDVASAEPRGRATRHSPWPNAQYANKQHAPMRAARASQPTMNGGVIINVKIASRLPTSLEQISNPSSSLTRTGFKPTTSTYAQPATSAAAQTPRSRTPHAANRGSIKGIKKPGKKKRRMLANTNPIGRSPTHRALPPVSIAMSPAPYVHPSPRDRPTTIPGQLSATCARAFSVPGQAANASQRTYTGRGDSRENAPHSCSA